MIYIHIPYCHGKCTYCAFYSIASQSGTDEYADAVCRELEMRSHEVNGRLPKTIYFGGGTPSILPITHLQRIVDCLRRTFDLSQTEECTIECNPEDLTDEYVSALRGLGFFNRISIGIQSFCDSDLRLLYRRHTAEEAMAAIHRIGDAGWDNVSIDLIYGLPGQDVEGWLSNLEKVRQIDPHHQCVQHLSCYALTVEPHTILERQISLGKIAPADEETVIGLYNALIEWCEANGFEQYEVSNFCTPHYASRHNSRYWNRTPYIGIGAAAHSFDGICRRWNVSNIRQYVDGVMDGTVYSESETLTTADIHNEYVMTALRTSVGIDKRMLGTYSEYVARRIKRFVSAGLIVESATHYKPTQQGLLQADGIAADLFVD
ncbi:MAG: radical SAM family heme chaperone HemW, partial [Bacteroidales bacterium]|nr:radical SAM family heme chaperone HemW [Bacteroidales bacterium]